MMEGEVNDFDDDDDEEDWTNTAWAEPLDHPTVELYIKSQCHTSLVSRPNSTGITAGHQAPASSSTIITREDQLIKNLERNTTKLEGEPGAGPMVRRMLLNDNKAGMEGLDKEKINQIIHEASKGSKFYENERMKEEQMKRRIEEQTKKIQKISDEQLKAGILEADNLLEDFDQQRDLTHTIVHIDMDAFYAAVEMRDKPELKNQPMAVGGNSMLSTSNYHARKFGVRAAMPGFIGRKLCPDLVIVPLNFEKYTACSKQVKAIIAEYDPNFCPMSLDEAYLDITEHMQNRRLYSEAERTFLCRDSTYADSRAHCLCDLNEILRNHGSEMLSLDDINSSNLKSEMSIPVAKNKNEILTFDGNKNEIKTDTREISVTQKSQGKVMNVCPVCKKEYPPFEKKIFGFSDEDVVAELRTRIEQKTRLTASAGIAPNMMLAKVCSDRNKPNGQYKIPATREAVMDFIRDLPTRKISGIGKVSEAMLNAVGVYTCTDMYMNRGLLFHLYSPISFNYFMRICLGIGSTTVERDSERKSMSTERTFSEMSKPADLYRKCEELSASLSEDLKSEQLKGRTVSIKIKTVKFEVRTRAHSLRDYTNTVDDILQAALDLLKTEIDNSAPHPLRLRLMGVRMSSLLHENMCKSRKQNTIMGAFRRQVELAKGETVSKANDTTPAVNTLSTDCESVGKVDRTAPVGNTLSTGCETVSKVDQTSPVGNTLSTDCETVSNVDYTAPAVNTLSTELLSTTQMSSGLPAQDNMNYDTEGESSNENELVASPGQEILSERQTVGLDIGNESDSCLQNRSLLETTETGDAVAEKEEQESKFKVNDNNDEKGDSSTQNNDEKGNSGTQNNDAIGDSSTQNNDEKRDSSTQNNDEKRDSSTQNNDEKGDSSTQNNDANGDSSTQNNDNSAGDSRTKEKVHISLHNFTDNNSEQVEDLVTDTVEASNVNDDKKHPVDSEKKFVKTYFEEDVKFHSRSNEEESKDCERAECNSDKGSEVKSAVIIMSESEATPARKTRSGTAFRTPNRSAKKRKRRTGNSDDSLESLERYGCPVCAKIVMCKGLRDFNKHVDDCLETSDTLTVDISGDMSGTTHREISVESSIKTLGEMDDTTPKERSAIATVEDESMTTVGDGTGTKPRETTCSIATVEETMTTLSEMAGTTSPPIETLYTATKRAGENLFTLTNQTSENSDTPTSNKTVTETKEEIRVTEQGENIKKKLKIKKNKIQTKEIMSVMSVKDDGGRGGKSKRGKSRTDVIGLCDDGEKEIAELYQLSGHNGVTDMKQDERGVDALEIGAKCNTINFDTTKSDNEIHKDDFNDIDDVSHDSFGNEFTQGSTLNRGGCENKSEVKNEDTDVIKEINEADESSCRDKDETHLINDEENVEGKDRHTNEETLEPYLGLENSHKRMIKFVKDVEEKDEGILSIKGKNSNATQLRCDNNDKCLSKYETENLVYPSTSTDSSEYMETFEENNSKKSMVSETDQRLEEQNNPSTSTGCEDSNGDGFHSTDRLDIVTPNKDSNSSLLICPVCNIEQRLSSLSEFNQHVDSCLSRGAITELLKEQREVEKQTLKRTRHPSTPSSSQQTKKRKTVIPGVSSCRSIASFFQK